MPYGDVTGTIAAIREAYMSPRRSEARNRIQSCFPLERRDRGLKAAIDELLDGGS